MPGSSAAAGIISGNARRSIHLVFTIPIPVFTMPILAFPFRRSGCSRCSDLQP